MLPERAKTKRTFTPEEREYRKRQDQRYRKVERPLYLLNLAQRQNHLKRSFGDIPGETLQEKLQHLSPPEFPRCEATLRETSCFSNQRIATQIHHRRGRRPVNDVDMYNNPEYFLGICDSCHDWIEANKEEAQKLGLVIRNQPI